MNILKSDVDEVKTKYYHPKDVCRLLNDEFNLRSRDIVIPAMLSYWRQKGYISYNASKNPVKITQKELNNIIGFTYLHIFLGISYRRLAMAQKYLKNLFYQQGVDGVSTDYLNLYEANSK